MSSNILQVCAAKSPKKTRKLGNGAGEKPTKNARNVTAIAPRRMIIAERTLRFATPGKRGSRKILVQFYSPQPEENGNWSVRIEIHGPGQYKKSQTIWGCDSVQALVLALSSVSLDLEALARELGGRVLFLGSDNLRFTATS